MNVKIISASIDEKILEAFNKYAEKSPYSRSTLITILLAQAVGIPYEPPRKKEGDAD